MSRLPTYLASHLERWRARAVDARTLAGAVRARLPELVRCLSDEFAAQKIILFGSVVRGDVDPGFDVDLAVRGLPSGRYFEALARVSEIVDRNVDLVDLGSARPSLIRHIEETGEVLYDATAA